MNLFLHELAVRAADTYGSRNLVVSDHGSLTFDELPGRAEQLASVLAKNAPSSKPGDVTWVRSSSHTTALTAAVAASLAGMAAVVADSWLGRRVGVDPLLTLSDEGIIRSPSGGTEEPNGRTWTGNQISSDPVIGFFTSGSSGTTKLVLGSHAALLSVTESITRYLGIIADDVIVTASPPQFDYGFYQNLIALNSGASVVVAGDVLALERQIRAHEVTVLALTATSLRAICRSPHARPSPKVRLIVSTGSPFPIEHVDDLARLYPNASITPMYGLTECKRALYGRLAIDDDGRVVEILDRPIPNLRAAFTDDGELTVMPGHAMTILTDGPEVATTDSVGRQILRTGDFFTFDERLNGYRFIGRHDDLVKIADRRISAIAVEQDLRKASPDREIIVMGLSEGDGSQRLAALHEGQVAVAEQASAPLVKSWLCVDALPRLANGKVDRRKARQLLERVPPRGTFVIEDGELRAADTQR